MGKTPDWQLVPKCSMVNVIRPYMPAKEKKQSNLLSFPRIRDLTRSSLSQLSLFLVQNTQVEQQPQSSTPGLRISGARAHSAHPLLSSLVTWCGLWCLCGLALLRALAANPAGEQIPWNSGTTSLRSAISTSCLSRGNATPHVQLMHLVKPQRAVQAGRILNLRERVEIGF